MPRSSLLGALSCLFAPQLTGRKPVARSGVSLAMGTTADGQACRDRGNRRGAEENHKELWKGLLASVTDTS